MRDSILQVFTRSIAASALCISALVAPVQAASDLSLGPYKDKLFGYPRVLEQNADHSFRVLDYDEARDIDARDEIPVRRANSWYVDTSVRRHEVSRTIKAGGRRIAVDQTGRLANARFAVIFIHGRGGDESLGASDWMFGGNFNRLKNLAVRNRGAYFAPAIASFDANGTADIAALVRYIAGQAPDAKIVLSCGSMGSVVCWRLANDKASVKRLSGLMILGGFTDDAFPSSAAFKAGLPLFIAHGSADPVYPWRKQKTLFDSIRAGRPDYPVQLVLLRTGKHGSPIRMADWRETLNWIFRVSPSR